MDAKRDKRIILGVKFLQLAEESARSKTMTEAMRDAGFLSKTHDVITYLISYSIYV
jgi:hypothetical protein